MLTLDRMREIDLAVSDGTLRRAASTMPEALNDPERALLADFDRHPDRDSIRRRILGDVLRGLP